MPRGALKVLRFPAAQSEPASEGPLGRIIVHRGPLGTAIQAMHRVIGELPPGECVAYAVQLTGTPVVRLRAVAGFRATCRRIERTMEALGASVVGHFAVDPDFDNPSCFYELGGAAAAYADRCLRPRGRAERIRRLIARVAGCDPALGAVLIVGRKR